MSAKLAVSLHDIGEVVVVHDSSVLLVSNAEAVEEIISVGLAEHRAIREAGGESGAITVLLDGLNNVSETLCLELLLGHHGVEISALNSDVGKVSLVNISGVHWMSKKSLIVWNWPSWGGHNSKGVVSIWVHRAQKGILGGEGSLGNYWKVINESKKLTPHDIF